MKYRFTFVALSSLLFFFSCNHDRKEIHDVAMGYLNATGNYLVDEAIPFATKETREVTIPFMRDKLMPLVDSAYIASDTPAHFVIDSITVETDTAWVYYTKTTPIKNFTDCIQVIKENGDWLVNVILDLPKMPSTHETITLQVAPDAKLQKNEN